MNNLINRIGLNILTEEFRKRFKSCWDYLNALDEEEFLQLRHNDFFIQLFKEIDFSNLNDDEILSLTSRTTIYAQTNIETSNEQLDLEAEQALENQNELVCATTIKQQDSLDVELEKGEYLGANSVAEYYQLSKALLDDLKNMRLNFASLNRSEHYALERIKQHEPRFNLNELVQRQIRSLGRYPRIGQKVITALEKLAIELGLELKAIEKKTINYNNFEAKYIVPAYPDIASIDDLHLILSEDINLFLKQLDEQNKEVFLTRTGFNNTQLMTLQELGDKFNVTRERIRQLESVIYENLFKSLRLSRLQIKNLIEQHLTFDLIDKMPSLSFSEDKCFYDFLAKLIDLPEINKISNPDEISIKVDLLDEFFAFNGVRVKSQELFNYLYEHEEIERYCEILHNSSLKEVVIENYIEKLIRLKRLTVLNKHFVMPSLLPKESAAAAVLCSYPSGLSWKAIAEKVNELGISRTKLETERPDNGAFGGSNPYLCGLGEYGNIKFLALEKVDFDLFFKEVFRIFELKNNDVLHLSSIHELFNKEIANDYYLLRYMIRNFGEDYGFYFNGKSQVDNVSLNKDFKTISQKDLITIEMKARSAGMNIDSIAQLLKSKSVSHAAYYLDQLMNAGEVVRIDSRLYSTPDVAYQGVNLKRILHVLHELIDNTDKPIDYSYFEYLLNEELNEDYSMYFYSSIARKYADERGWHRRQNLFSNEEIIFTSTSDVAVWVCNPKDSIEHQIACFKKEVYITDERAKRVIYQVHYQRNEEKLE